MIEFDEVQHRYTVGGIVRPSVTEVIRSAGLMDERWWTEESRTRGRYVHMATHFIDEDDLDIETVTEKYRAYVNAWVRFKREARFTADLIEHRVFHTTLGYCGTLDRTGTLDGGSRVLLDIKTGLPAPWHPVQIAAYSNCFDRPDQFRRMTVLLKKDGTFKVYEYPASRYLDHWNTFLAAMQLFNFKMEGKNVSERSIDSAA